MKPHESPPPPNEKKSIRGESGDSRGLCGKGVLTERLLESNQNKKIHMHKGKLYKPSGRLVGQR